MLFINPLYFNYSFIGYYIMCKHRLLLPLKICYWYFFLIFNVLGLNSQFNIDILYKFLFCLDLYFMGLVEYGKGKWNKIVKHYLWNTTPHQVQCNATVYSFFKYLPTTYVHGLRNRNVIANPHQSASNRNINSSSDNSYY